MRSLVATIPFLLALTLVLVPAASAQAPTPTMSIAISGLPAQFSGLVSNATVEAPFKVDVTINNVVCPTAGSIPVTLAVTGASPPAFFTVAVDPASGAVAVGAGPHAQPTTGSVDAKLVATLKDITANASVPVKVTATAGAPTGCQGAGAVNGATAEATVFANMTAPPPPPPPTPAPAESPGPGALMGIVAAVFAAAFWRRRAA